jgi:hypothetical protein
MYQNLVFANAAMRALTTFCLFIPMRLGLYHCALASCRGHYTPFGTNYSILRNWKTPLTQFGFGNGLFTRNLYVDSLLNCNSLRIVVEYHV